MKATKTSTGKIRALAFCIAYLLIPGLLSSQSLPDFSGVWEQDNVKSDDFYKSFNVTCTIKQTPSEISIDQAFFSKEGEKITSMVNSYNLDGKEVSVEEQGGINKKSANWSADRKVLTITETRTMGTEVYGSHRAFSLSGDGKVLTVETTDANPLTGLKIKQIFNKK
jgi:hypothetical protein